jgi:hypothetical protein
MLSESPCRDTCPGRSYDPYEKGPYCTNQPIDDEVEYQYACGPYARYLGQQEGYAKGAWEVVDYLAEKALRKKMGSKKGKIIQVFKVFGNDYMTSRMMYIVSFDTESVWLWSYQLTKVGKAR